MVAFFKADGSYRTLILGQLGQQPTCDRLRERRRLLSERRTLTTLFTSLELQTEGPYRCNPGELAGSIARRLKSSGFGPQTELAALFPILLACLGGANPKTFTLDTAPTISRLRQSYVSALDATIHSAAALRACEIPCRVAVLHSDPAANEGDYDIGEIPTIFIPSSGSLLSINPRYSGIIPLPLSPELAKPFCALELPNSELLTLYRNVVHIMDVLKGYANTVSINALTDSAHAMASKRCVLHFEDTDLSDLREIGHFIHTLNAIQGEVTPVRLDTDETTPSMLTLASTRLSRLLESTSSECVAHLFSLVKSHIHPVENCHGKEDDPNHHAGAAADFFAMLGGSLSGRIASAFSSISLQGDTAGSEEDPTEPNAGSDIVGKDPPKLLN